MKYTITLFTMQKCISRLVMAAALGLMALPASAQDCSQVGNPVGPKSFQPDGFTGQVIILLETGVPTKNSPASFCADGRVTSWRFYRNDPRPEIQIPLGDFYRVITPLIVERTTDPDNTEHFYVRGIGTGRVGIPKSTVVQHHDFGLVQGHDFVRGDGNWFFGWYDGDLVGNLDNPLNQAPHDHSGNIEYEEFQEIGFRTMHFGNGWGPYGFYYGVDLTERKDTTGIGYGPRERLYAVKAFIIEGIVPAQITAMHPDTPGNDAMVDFINNTENDNIYSLEMATGLIPPITWNPVPGAALTELGFYNMRFTFDGLSDSNLFFQVLTAEGE